MKYYVVACVTFCALNAFEEKLCQNEVVVFIARPNQHESCDLVYATNTMLAFCNLKTMECKAFNLKDSGCTELDNPKQIFNELKNQYYQAIKQSLHDRYKKKKT